MKKNKLDFILLTICFAICFLANRLARFFSFNISINLFLILILLFSIYFTIKYKINKLYLIATIFCFIADIFLSIIRDGEYITELGLTSFIIAQFFFMLFMYSKGVNNKKIFIILKISLIIILQIIIPFIFKDSYNYIIVATSIYAVLLIFNIIESFFLKKKNLLLSIGFILFFLCDFNLMFCVARSMNIFDATNIPIINLAFIIYNSCWLFYIPSHYFLLASLIKE